MFTPPQTLGEKVKKSLQSSFEAKDAKRNQLVALARLWIIQCFTWSECTILQRF